MKAEFQAKHGDIRVFREGERYGDKYAWCSSMQIFSDGESCEIGPYQDKIPLSVFKALVKMLQRMGIKRVKAVTYPEGAAGPRHEKWITIPSQAQEFYKHDLTDDKKGTE